MTSPCNFCPWQVVQPKIIPTWKMGFVVAMLIFIFMPEVRDIYTWSKGVVDILGLLLLNGDRMTILLVKIF